jgi:hypothetical protein
VENRWYCKREKEESNRIESNNRFIMIVDTSAVSDFLELILLTVYAYIESVLISIGLNFFKRSGNNNASSIGKETVCDDDDDVDCLTKTERIERCLGTTNPVDLWELRELALSDGGLLRGMYDLLIKKEAVVYFFFFVYFSYLLSMLYSIIFFKCESLTHHH